MKSFYASDLRPGDDLVNELFLLQDVARRSTKDGRSFLLFSARDKTGAVSAVFWDVPDQVSTWVRSGEVVLLSGRANNYKDSLQISTTDLIQNPTSHMAELLPSSPRPQAEMLVELRKTIESLGQPWQRLVSHILLDDLFLPQFANAPAARQMHHAYIGGVLEHTLSMATIADLLASHYPYVNRDLLVSGVLLHDMGKTMEYDLAGSFSFTEDGRLVGHIVRAIILIEKAAVELGDVPPEDIQQLVHLVASHHGNLEWGSPTEPKTLEAMLLHQIDLLDSRIQGFLEHAQTDVDDSGWTIKPSPMFRNEIKRPASFE
ncbi:MAG: HD domain-containing protein [Anaerolineae bacterium]|nr:HD domain-containing protein [Anaerolineae bacterium]